jgi:transcriptional regulator with XRE-family HTH domain
MQKYKLKGLIFSYGYNYKSFSETSGIGYDRIKKVCKSQINISVDDIIKICRTLKISPLIFFPEDVTKHHEIN